jgi:hypothetical protein
MPAAARVVTELEVDASKAIASLNAYDAATGKAATGSLRLVESGRGIERQLDRVRAAADPAIAATQKMERAQATVDAAFKRGLISQTEAGRVIGQLKDHYSVAGREAETFGGRIRGAGEGLKEYSESLSKYTVAFGIGSVALFGGPELIRRVRETVSYLHEVGDAASTAGISSEKLQVLRYAVEQTGGSADQADSSMKHFSKTIGEMELTGTGPAKEAMDALGVSVRDAAGHFRSNEAIFSDVVSKLSRVADQSQAAAVAARLFSRDGWAAMASAVSGGNVALEDAEQHLKSLNGVISDESIKQAEELDNKFKDLSLTVERFAEKSLVDVATGFVKQEESIKAFLDSPSLRRFLQVLGQDEGHLNIFAPPTPADRISETFSNLGEPDQALQNALRRKVQGTITLPDVGETDKQAKAIESLFSAYDKGTADIVANTNAIGLNHEQMVSQETTMKLVNDAVAKGIQLSPQLVDRINQEADARTNATLALEKQQEAERQAISRMDDLRDSTKGFIDTLATGGDIVDFFKRKLLDLGETQLTNALFGQQGTSGQGSLLGGIFGNLFGMGSSPAPQSVTSKIGYGIPIPWAGGVTSRDLPPLPNGTPNGMSASLTGVQGQVYNYFAGKGLSPTQIAGIMGHTSVESGFDPAAVEKGGSGIGLFQDTGPRADALKAAVPDWATNPQGQLDFAWKELTGPEKQHLIELANAQDVKGATAAFGGFERPQGYNPADPTAMSRWSDRLGSAQQFDAQFDSSLKQITQTAQTGASNFSVFPEHA